MRVGVLGAGQLGRMLALAGYPLGLRFRFLDPAPGAPAGHLAEQCVAPFDDPSRLDLFVHGLDVITYEFENVPVELPRWLGQRIGVYPPPVALEVSQDRLAEKTLFGRLGLPTAPFVAVDTREQLNEALEGIGYPAVLKTRRLGYDGKGQHVIREPADRGDAWRRLGGVPLLLEGFVAFQRELSILAVRGRDGAMAFYPLVENEHAGGILRRSRAPAPDCAGTLQELAQDYAGRVLRQLDYVGVLAIEFFEHQGRLVANEMAPRVHNSGHWTIEGAVTSQFENHLRAILGWPLGSTEVPSAWAMVNLIGRVPPLAAVLAIPGAHLHLYGKSPRPGRKLGHVTVQAFEAGALAERLAAVQRLVDAAGE
jgi:5-(carboxyamino)imidazole ribonucleotide synthase